MELFPVEKQKIFTINEKKRFESQSRCIKIFVSCEFQKKPLSCISLTAHNDRRGLCGSRSRRN